MQIGKWRWWLREGWITQPLEAERDPNLGPFPLQGCLTLLLRWSTGELDFKRSAPGTDWLPVRGTSTTLGVGLETQDARISAGDPAGQGAP